MSQVALAGTARAALVVTSISPAPLTLAAAPEGRGAVVEAQAGARRDRDGAVGAEAPVAAGDVEDARLDGERAVDVEQERQGRRAVGELAQGRPCWRGCPSRAGCGRW